MSQTVGDFLLDRFSSWGVKRIYGYPGDGINGVMRAFERSSNGQGPEFIQVHHEEMAAFMACAHAKFTGGRAACAPRVEGRYARRAERVLLASLGVERDRLRRPGVSARILAFRRRSARELGGGYGVRARFERARSPMTATVRAPR